MFNFGAMLGGAAEQIVADIDEKEKEVKLRTRTILDRQVQESYANRKEYKSNKKKVQEQLNSIVSYFGDDPDRWNKARAIVAGGDAHVGKMSSIFETAQSNKQNINEIYGLAKTDKDSTLTNIEDATNSLVQMAQIATPNFGASKQTSTLFGQTDMGTVYSKARKEFEQSGLLDAIPTATESGATYGSGKLDLASLKQDAKPIAQQKANILRDINASTEGSPERKAAEQKQENINIFERKNSLALYIEQEKLKNKGKGSISLYSNTLKQGILEIENKYKSDTVTGTDGNIIDPTKKSAIKEQAIIDYKKDFVDTIIRSKDGIDDKALTVIQADPVLNKIYEDALKAEQDKIKGGGDTSKKDDKELSFFQQQEKLLKEKNKKDRITKQRTDFKNKYTNISDGVKDLFKDKKNSKEDIFETIKNIYPDKEEAEIYAIVSKVEAELGAKPSSDTVVESVPPRPDSGNLIFDSDAEDAWDKKYRATHFRDGKPKPTKKYGTRRKNRSK
jgi:hypothetical protein